MPNISDMNIVIGQASAIKQMRAAAEQDVELNRQFISHAAHALNNKKQIQVKTMEPGYKTQMRADDDKKALVPAPLERIVSSDKQELANATGGTFVDIKV
ncbi:hypothetical protein [Desulfocicer niacini]